MPPPDGEGGPWNRWDLHPSVVIGLVLLSGAVLIFSIYRWAFEPFEG